MTSNYEFLSQGFLANYAKQQLRLSRNDFIDAKPEKRAVARLFVQPGETGIDFSHIFKPSILTLKPLQETPLLQPLSATNEEQNTQKSWDVILSPQEKLTNRIQKIQSREEENRRERGRDGLFCCVGFLRWHTREKTDRWYETPLLLFPFEFTERGETKIKVEDVEEGHLNPFLQVLLQSNWGIVLPEFEWKSRRNSEMPPNQIISEYLQSIQNRITEKEGWEIYLNVLLGSFVIPGIPPQELNPAAYPPARVQQLEERLFRDTGILSDSTFQDPEAEAYRNTLPTSLLEADSSQLSCLLTVQQGHDLVIQGPPGTGKSQTIVNLIADAIVRQKKVLFLAQKTAALEVVYQRLVELGLSHKCLPLYPPFVEHKSRLYEHMETVIQKHEQTGNHHQILSRVKALRKERDQIKTGLDTFAYKSATFLGQTSLQWHQVSGHAAQTRHPRSLLQWRGWELLTDLSFQQGMDWIAELQKNENKVSNSLKHTFRHYPIQSEQDWNQKQRMEALFQEWVPILTHLGSWTLTQVEQHLQRLHAIQGSLLQLRQASELWMSYTQERMSKTFTEEVLYCSVLPWWKRWFSSEAKHRMALLHSKLLSSETSLSIVHIQLNQALQMHELATSQLQQLQGQNYTEELVQQHLDWYQHALQKTRVILKDYHLQIWDQLPASDMLAQVQSWLQTPAVEKNLIIKWIKDLQQLCKFWPLVSPISELLLQPVRRIQEDFWRAASEWMLQQFPWLSQGTSDEMQRLQKHYHSADQRLSTAFQQWVCSTPVTSPLQTGAKSQRVSEKKGAVLIRHAALTPRMRVTLREFCQRAMPDLSSLCQCFLATPSTVAHYIPRDTDFDLLLIDEASQMLVADALGSMLRSHQFIVVGDSQQMPPSVMMRTMFEDEKTTEEDQEQLKKESILERAEKAFHKQICLKYHYRSLDESLITFSNHRFYNNSLEIVPTGETAPDCGVFLHYLENARYYAGKSSRPNPEEALALVNAIQEHMILRPQDSLGVAVMNIRQMEAVRELFEEKQMETPLMQDFLERWRTTPGYFFIKNLENVQGDERDVIIIGTVFGKDENGDVHQRFGINKEGDEKRINVLITRAKKSLKVFTSLKPNEIRSTRPGPRILSEFLEFAQTGKVPQVTRSEGDRFDSPWERWFCERLRREGYQVDTQVGVSNWRIDLAIRHPAGVGYLCGIELDGASYHSALTTRDRDLHRQKVLESRGWTILRVWSTDFFRDQEGEFQILLHQIKQLQRQDP